MESKKVVEESFSGSLPRFIASFLGNRSLSDDEVDELIDLINQHKGDKDD